MPDRVLVTGVSGFLGGHLALQLLQAGFLVRGSVRSLRKAEEVRATLGRAGADLGRLEIVELDLESDRGWPDAMAGVRFLQHTASPLQLRVPKDADELIRPAVGGTRRAIAAALQAGVERVVLTSSIAAIQYGHAQRNRVFTEADWTNPSQPAVGAYPQSKTLAEREAWRQMEQAGRRKDLAVVNPAVILGPLLSDDPGTSSVVVRRLLDGSLPAVPRMALSLVDVRDVVALLVDAMSNREAGGERCIASAGTCWISELGGMLRPAFPDRRIPTRQLPAVLVRLAALVSRTVRDNVGEMGLQKRLDESRAPQRLGRPLIPVAEAAVATGRSLLAHGLLR